jgi:alkylated DNA repair dioxygenase AlkB
VKPSHPQADLFAGAPALPEGFEYRPDFVSAPEEAALVAAIADLPLAPARYKAYVARRRTASYGASYDYDANRLGPAPALPAFLLPLRARVGAWLAIEPSAFEHALVTKYEPGTPIGWHRDVPDFEVVVGVSLLGWCRMRLRPYPPQPRQRKDVVEIALAPRSAYVLRGPARWGWQHQIPPVAELRCSITFRTRRPGARRTTHARSQPGE